MGSVDKKVIQKYWTQNVPGLDMVTKGLNPEQKEFYLDVDAYRYRFDSYIPGIIDSFAEKGKLILEIGCGMGTDSRYISKKGANIVSFDLSWDNVNFSLKGLSLMELKGKGVCGDGEKLPFKDNVFDVVYSFGVLHHTPDTQKAIDEAYRVLKPNGKAVIMLYHKGYAYYVLLFLHGYKRLFRIYNQDKLMSQYDHTPLSRMYSREELFKIFTKFNSINISITTYGGIQAHKFLKYIYVILHKSRFLMRRFGSFAVIRGEK
ncbi:MAG: class I SAM-dependent methyltransferase [Candidatus Omnitrophota bacterium]